MKREEFNKFEIKHTIKIVLTEERAKEIIAKAMGVTRFIKTGYEMSENEYMEIATIEIVSDTLKEGE